MSKYGLDFYGQAFYGPNQLVNFDASPFSATATDYRTVFLSWNNPSGAWTRIRLVRNSYGYPTNESDGKVLFDLNNGPSATAPLDPSVSFYLDSLLAPGQFYYYSLFVYGLNAYNGRDDWRRAGTVTGLSVKDYGYVDKLVNMLPTVYTTEEQAIESANGDSTTDIYRFLSLPAFQLSVIRSQYDSLLNVNDPTHVAGSLLPLLANQFGISYEPELGMEQLRVLLRNIQHIYKLKGTTTGIEALCEAFTNWSTSCTVGVNMMLDYNSSSAEESVGLWAINGVQGALAWRAADGSIPAFSVPGNKIAGMMSLTGTTGSGTGIISLGFAAPVSSCVPVNPTQQYVASAYARAGSTGRTVTLGIAWYDSSGTLITGTTGTGTDVAGSWTRISASGAAPANAAYAGLSLSTDLLPAAEVHYFDAIQFETGTTPTTFQEARDLRIVLLADRVNEVTNPSFETNTTGWTATGTTAISRSFAQALFGALSRNDAAGTTSGSATVTDPSIGTGDNGKPVTGTGIPANSYVGTVTAGTSFLLSSSATSQVNVNATATNASNTITLSQKSSLKVVNDSQQDIVYTTTTPVPGIDTYTFSCWVFGPAGTYRVARFQDLPVGGSNGIFGANVTVPLNTWTRVSGTFTLPVGETKTRWALQGPSSATFWVDGVLVERGSVVRDYFDTSLGITHPADYLWEGTANASRSHYYSNRQIKISRLNSILPDYLWSGMTYTLLQAQPGV